MTPFAFLDPGELVDGELRLVLEREREAEPDKGYVPAYDFALRLDGVTAHAGRVQLRAVCTPHLELYGGYFGYAVEPEYRGRRLAERAVRLLLPLARRHGIDPVWITCNPDNGPSRRTLERLGAQLVELIALPAGTDMYERGERHKCRYRITH